MAIATQQMKDKDVDVIKALVLTGDSQYTWPLILLRQIGYEALTVLENAVESLQ